ncbi:PREDICTED: major antigen [Tarenaya hassleriana]|uniref:major antigen n=1 Tax=Tarenaya hassleriana TaxID=28532 RepID=UPI00053C87FC|nr:PREDICTED: major antigen [Tarenaya hassleriana]
MSSSSSSGRTSRSDSDSAFDVDELVQIGTRCRELRREKEMLRESQSESVELVRRLELHAKSLSESRLEDKGRIQTLEKELVNCYQEIDYLQDQLSLRNKEVDYLSEHVHSLEVKLAESGHLEEEVNSLREELFKSESEHFLLLQELGSKETELQYSAYSVEKLEESISSLTLESQCEIESMKLDMIALEHALSDAKKIQEESVHEKDQLREIIEELRLQSQEAQENIGCLEKLNKTLRERCDATQRNVAEFCRSVKKWVGSEEKLPIKAEFFFAEFGHELPLAKELRECFDAIIEKLQVSRDVNLSEKVECMSKQINQYENLIKHLKDELRDEKLKAKEEAEDLAQEMAELRYKMTCLLEEECRRRASIEQASLQRIGELEAQIKKEKNTSMASMISLPGV